MIFIIVIFYLGDLCNGDACLIGPSEVLAYNNLGEIRHGLITNTPHKLCRSSKKKLTSGPERHTH